MSDEPVNEGAHARRRRIRYAGKYPRRFEEKYKEHAGSPETIQKVIASGKTPAGTHRPIMVQQVLEALAPAPGMLAADCTVGFGGHAEAILERIQPNGRLIGLDVDPIELPKAEARLRGQGYGSAALSVFRSNYAGLPKVLAGAGIEGGVDVLIADLGLSSMQIDNPSRGFSVKFEGPLDMRMNPNRGQPASALIRSISPDRLAEILVDNADEPNAAVLAHAIAGRGFSTTADLSRAISAALKGKAADFNGAVRRVFQALRIAVNDEFSALETFLRILPSCLRAGGRAAILTFHSGEDRRVKKAFESGLRDGTYADISDVIRPSPEERRSNPRSAPAKLRWARRSAASA